MRRRKTCARLAAEGLGVYQTILIALAMIIICAMVGTRNLGQEVFIGPTKSGNVPKSGTCVPGIGF
ncbi:MAG: hypothetical protein E5W87_01640 [Mesorhizobium sp.]|nr:MAG: hypothetical protein E5W87_01640 [Mesorhizobium sp.]